MYFRHSNFYIYCPNLAFYQRISENCTTSNEEKVLLRREKSVSAMRHLRSQYRRDIINWKTIPGNRITLSVTVIISLLRCDAHSKKLPHVEKIVQVYHKPLTTITPDNQKNQKICGNKHEKHHTTGDGGGRQLSEVVAIVVVTKKMNKWIAKSRNIFWNVCKVVAGL